MEEGESSNGGKAGSAAQPQEGVRMSDLGLTPEEVKQLTTENRCFRCKEVGHWLNNCPHRAPGGTKDEVLLQIINSGIPGVGRCLIRFPKIRIVGLFFILLNIYQLFCSHAPFFHIFQGRNKSKYKYQCQSPHVAGKKLEPRYNQAILEQVLAIIFWLQLKPGNH